MRALLTAKEAGALLNVPASWVLAEARADRIPHVRLGRYVRFEADELAMWWRSRARGPWRGGAAPAAGAGGVGGGVGPAAPPTRSPAPPRPLGEASAARSRSRSSCGWW